MKGRSTALCWIRPALLQSGIGTDADSGAKDAQERRFRRKQRFSSGSISYAALHTVQETFGSGLASAIRCSPTFNIPTMERCPQCKHSPLRRSRTRSLIERLRKAVTPQRPHRCPECGWRGWGPERNPHETGAIESGQVPDFGIIDAELEEKGVRAETPSDSTATGAPRNQP